MNEELRMSPRHRNNHENSNADVAESIVLRKRAYKPPYEQEEVKLAEMYKKIHPSKLYTPYLALLLTHYTVRRRRIRDEKLLSVSRSDPSRLCGLGPGG